MCDLNRKYYKIKNGKPKLKMLVLGASHTDWSFYSLKSWSEMLFEKLSEKAHKIGAKRVLEKLDA